MISASRELAFAVVDASFEDGAFTERAFRELAGPLDLDGRERAQAQRLAYGAVQRRGTTDAAIARLARRPAGRLDPPVRSALRLGLYELLFSERTPDHAAVDQAVELVKRAGAAHASGFVNAVLRRAAREGDGLRDELIADDSTPAGAAVAHSVPEWLATMWWEELGAEVARSLLAACNRRAETAFRVGPAGGDPKAICDRLRAAGLEAGPAAGPWPLDVPESLVINGRAGEPVPDLVAEGVLTPQSRGSAAVVEVLDPQPGDHVLDICAGPGIKSGQIAARMGDRGEVVAIENDSERAAEVAAQATRLGLRGLTVIEADATTAAFGAAADRVLVDAPCSDLGALASRPDARWRKTPRVIERLRGTQDAILRRAAATLRPGGTLVYSTCTISRRENEDAVGRLLTAAGQDDVPALELDDLSSSAPGLASGHEPRTLQLRPDRDGTTGFFIARFRRPPSGGG